ncbi:unnamed protein product [Sphagnum balticum]
MHLDTILLLDEANRMVLESFLIVYFLSPSPYRSAGLGFEPQIRTIVECLPAERESMMVTATWPREVQTLALGTVSSSSKIWTIRTRARISRKWCACLRRRRLCTAAGDQLWERLNAAPKTIVFVARK